MNAISTVVLKNLSMENRRENVLTSTSFLAIIHKATFDVLIHIAYITADEFDKR